jgi:hypothetical protein
MSRKSLIEETGIVTPLIAGYMRFTLRFIAPAVVGAIFVSNLV